MTDNQKLKSTSHRLQSYITNLILHVEIEYWSSCNFFSIICFIYLLVSIIIINIFMLLGGE